MCEVVPEALLATAVPDPMATPISAFFRAGASLTPSPVWRQTHGRQSEEEEKEGGGVTHHGQNLSFFLQIVDNLALVGWLHAGEQTSLETSLALL